MAEIIRTVIDIFLHLDKNLAMVIGQYGTATYGLLFLIIFMETGFVVTPFLPGDSLIFAAAALSATSSLSTSGGFNIWVLYILLLIAAILGDTVNYWIGHFIGPKVFEKDSKLIKKAYLIKTQKFYDKYGGQAITIGRFVPIVRTFVPFVAGVAKMSYKFFFIYNILGGILWVSLFTWTGYFFGNLPFVKANFHYVVVVIILISITPIVYEFVKSKIRK
ncbi:MAG: DedA family protein [Candidatus Woesebacteria bacterium]|nr:DedA family protein [Candidatus Woesebacteria bacterium]